MKPLVKYSVPKAAALALAALALASCIIERPIDPPTPTTGARFTVSVSAPASPATRNIPNGGTADNLVENITILLFDPADDNEYRGRVRGTNLDNVEGDRTRWTFSAEIPNGTYTALFMANMEENLGDYDFEPGNVGVPPVEIDILEGALKHYVTGGGPFEKYNAKPGTAGYKPFVMSSARTPITVSGADITVPRNPIPLYRDVAKINLEVDIDPDSDEKFDLTQIILVNYNTETFAVPSPELTAMWNDPDPDLTDAERIDRPLFDPDVVRSGTNFIQPPENSITYAGPGDEAEISADQQTCIDEIFTFERLAWEDGRHLCLIVQGNVTIDGVRRTGRYYKLELRKENPEAGGALEYINILRNYAYTISITDVQNFGYDNETEAYYNEIDGLVTDITATDERGMNEFVYNGRYQLAVNRSLFELPAAAGPYPDLKVYTDYQYGWRLAGIEYVNGNGWLTVTSANPPDEYTAGTEAANTPGTSTTVTLTTVTDNDTGSAREAKLRLTAGNLHKYVTVRQAVLTKITVRYVDADDKNTEIRHSDTHIVVPGAYSYDAPSKITYGGFSYGYLDFDNTNSPPSGIIDSGGDIIITFLYRKLK